ncbi:DEKNAAC101559 [Brettanomyces naardenensis]|uniref:DEKNAAC101559 n=1 Tax=Brettanomyces naardenensis TaxID=13370 RepID=A0A448YIF9_BRENA|nr:DEKNAAC101559 [Brettanomyces naardenensis]
MASSSSAASTLSLVGTANVAGNSTGTATASSNGTVSSGASSAASSSAASSSSSKAGAAMLTPVLNFSGSNAKLTTLFAGVVAVGTILASL